MEHTHIALHDLFAVEQVRIPFRLGAFERRSAAKYREWHEARQRATADLDDTFGFVLKRRPWHHAPHQRLLPEQQFGKANAAAVLGRGQELVRLPRRPAAEG